MLHLLGFGQLDQVMRTCSVIDSLSFQDRESPKTHQLCHNHKAERVRRRYDVAEQTGGEREDKASQAVFSVLYDSVHLLCLVRSQLK